MWCESGIVEQQRVLILKVSMTEVAGFDPLPRLQQEVAAISHNHIATELSEPLRRRDILRAILDNEPFDIIHFAGHLNEEGFVASEEIIPLDMVVMYIQTGHPRLVFFSTCTSEKVAEMVASRCPSDCIFTVSDIDNEDAIDFSMMFYSTLRSPDIESYKEARDRVDPTGARFRYMPGKSVIVRRGDEVTQRIAALEMAVGGGRLGEIGIVQRLFNLERRLNDLERSFDERLDSLEEFNREEVAPALAIVRRDYTAKGSTSERLLWALFAISIATAIVIAGVLYYLVK